MQSSMLSTHHDCTYSWAALFNRALTRSPAQWATRVMLIGRVSAPSEGSRGTTEAARAEMWGSAVGSVILLSNADFLPPPLTVWQSLVYSSQIQKALSELMKACLQETENTTYTRRENTPLTHQRSTPSTFYHHQTGSEHDSQQETEGSAAKCRRSAVQSFTCLTREFRNSAPTSRKLEKRKETRSDQIIDIPRKPKKP